MELKGRYVKVLDDSHITHYPCKKGDYILFRKYDEHYREIEYWGEENKQSNYWGTLVHLNPKFQLMPIGFHPGIIEPIYDIY